MCDTKLIAMRNDSFGIVDWFDRSIYNQRELAIKLHSKLDHAEFIGWAYGDIWEW